MHWMLNCPKLTPPESAQIGVPGSETPSQVRVIIVPWKVSVKVSSTQPQHGQATVPAGQPPEVLLLPLLPPELPDPPPQAPATTVHWPVPTWKSMVKLLPSHGWANTESKTTSESRFMSMMRLQPSDPAQSKVAVWLPTPA